MSEYVSLKKYEEKIKSDVIGVEAYVDVIKIRVTNLAAREKVQEIINTNENEYGKHEIQENLESRKQKSWRGTVGYSLRITRPSDSLLQKLVVSLRGSNYTISYLEVAVDLLTRSHQAACGLIYFLAPLVVVTNIPSPISIKPDEKCKMQSVYFNTYEDLEMFKMYLLEENNNKHGSPALHTEFRLNTAKKLEREGFSVLTDVIEKDLLEWYKQRIQIVQVNGTQVGRVLCAEEERGEVSDRQARKVFLKSFAQYDLEGDIPDQGIFLAHFIFHTFKKYPECLIEPWHLPWDVLQT